MPGFGTAHVGAYRLQGERGKILCAAEAARTHFGDDFIGAFELGSASLHKAWWVVAVADDAVLLDSVFNDLRAAQAAYRALTVPGRKFSAQIAPQGFLPEATQEVTLDEFLEVTDLEVKRFATRHIPRVLAAMAVALAGGAIAAMQLPGGAEPAPAADTTPNSPTYPTFTDPAALGLACETAVAKALFAMSGGWALASALCVEDVAQLVFTGGRGGHHQAGVSRGPGIGDAWTGDRILLSGCPGPHAGRAGPRFRHGGRSGEAPSRSSESSHPRSLSTQPPSTTPLTPTGSNFRSRPPCPSCSRRCPAYGTPSGRKSGLIPSNCNGELREESRSVRPSLTACLLSAVLQLTVVYEPAAQANDPVQELRDRQQRLSNLEFAIREAELLHRLCHLSPENPECRTEHPEKPDPAGEPLATSSLDYRLIEVFGAANHLQAVLAGPEGGRRTARSGTELAPGLTVNRIYSDSVELSTPTGVATLRIGDH